MAVREFDAVDDDIVCATGGLSGMAYGTIAVLVKLAAAGSSEFRALFYSHDSGANLLGAVLLWTNDDWNWFTSGGGADGPVSSTGVWYVMVVRKDTGTVAPRFSVYNYGTDTWTHADGDASMADWATPGAGGSIRFSNAGASDFLTGRMAARAAWANEVHWSADATGDSAIEAAGLETALSNWLGESPTALWRFNQAATTEDVLDETGNGADQTSITGTTVVTGDDPPGFDFSLGTEVVPESAAHAHTAEQPALTQVHEITVNDAAHGHTVDQPAVEETGGVSPADAQHGHLAQQPTLTQTHQLTPDAASHGHTASEPLLDGVEVFSGGTLPDGWTAVQPANTAVELPGPYLQLAIDPGQSIDSLASGTTPDGPLVWRDVSGAFDFAVGLAEEATNLPNQGLDLLALDSGMNAGVRLGAFTGTQSGDFRNDIGWFVFGSNAGTAFSDTGDTAMGGLYGGPGWLRLAYDGSGTYTAYASHTGRSGSWSQLASFSDAFTPTRFAIHANSADSGVDGRLQRVNRVVDLAARGTDDATDPPAVDSRPTLFTEDFASGTLPAWLTPVTANNGTVTTTTSGVELAIDEATFQSQAWLLTPTDLPPSHGLLLRYQLTSTGFVNAFWVPAVAVQTTTDIPGAKTPDDKWGDGTSLIMEMPARDHATAGDLLRMLRRSPIDDGASQTGSREFDGYTLMIEDDEAPVTTVDTPLTWLRIERVGHWLQVKVWYDGDPEPAEWTYQAQDHMRRGLGAAITLSQNDTVSGSNTASVRFDRVTVYEVLSGSDLTTDDSTHGHTAESPALTQDHQLTTADAQHTHVADQPTLTQVHELVVDDAVHGHAADGPALTQTHELAGQDATHSHLAEQAVVSEGQIVVPDDASHSQTAAGPVLAQQHSLTVDPAVHAQLAEQVALAQLHQLAPDSAFHTHVAATVSLDSGVAGLTASAAARSTTASTSVRSTSGEVTVR